MVAIPPMSKTAPQVYANDRPSNMPTLSGSHMSVTILAARLPIQAKSVKTQASNQLEHGEWATQKAERPEAVRTVDWSRSYARSVIAQLASSNRNMHEPCPARRRCEGTD